MVNLIRNFALAFVLFFTFSTWAAKAPRNWRRSSQPCVSAVTAPQAAAATPTESLERITQPVFYIPQPGEFTAYDQIVKKHDRALSRPQKIDKIRNNLKEDVGYAVEPLPLVMRKEVADMLFAAAIQRARAVHAWFKDIYGNEDSAFLNVHPEFATVLNSSAMFAKEIVGSSAARANPFNFSLAMDVLLTENPDGTMGFRVAESDTGAIGGNFRMAQLAQALSDIWGEPHLYKQFIDPRESVIERMIRHRKNASKNKVIPNGRSLLFVEFESTFDQTQPTIMQKWLKENGILLASKDERHKLKFDPLTKRYFYPDESGQMVPITDFWLESYTEPLDPNWPLFDRISDTLKNDEFQMAHTIPDFWVNWFNGGYKNMVVHNGTGIEILSDKGMLEAIPLAIRLYLKEEPLLNGSAYTNISKFSGAERSQFIDKIFADADNTVLKSRVETGGQGKGVLIGRFMKNGREKDGYTWESLKKHVTEHPEQWVYQPFMQERPLVLADGRRRTYEFRVIVNFENGQAHPIHAVYIRSSAEGTLRGMSTTKNATTIDLNKPSIIPVLVPR